MPEQVPDAFFHRLFGMARRGRADRPTVTARLAVPHEPHAVGHFLPSDYLRAELGPQPRHVADGGGTGIAALFQPRGQGQDARVVVFDGPQYRHEGGVGGLRRVVGGGAGVDLGGNAPALPVSLEARRCVQELAGHLRGQFPDIAVVDGGVAGPAEPDGVARPQQMPAGERGRTC